mgnify:CR=1 FL=1
MVGSNQKWAIERIYLKYLKELNPDTILFAAQNRLHEYLQKSILNKVLYRLNTSNIIRKINAELINTVEEFKPDIIWVLKGMEVLPDTLKIFNQKKIKLVNYNPDHPFIRSGRGSWNRNVLNSVPLYDLHLCYSKSLMKTIKDKYKIRTEFLPFGFELDDNLFRRIKDNNEINKVCFLGNPDKIRYNLIKYLIGNGIQVDVYGYNWNKFFRSNSSSNLNIYDAVYEDKFWETLRKYRVQLNIFRPHNIGSHNMRTFEITAVGGIQLAPDSPEHREFFEDGKEIFLYKSNDEAIDKIKYLLELNDDEATKIREASRSKCINGDYSYKNRAQTSFNFFISLLEEKK